MARTRIVCIKIDRDLLEALDEVRALKRLNRSEAIREAIARWVQEERGGGEKWSTS